MPAHPGVPRDFYELRLSQLWSNVLHRDDVGMKEDFFALGGDPTRAEALVAEISARFDTPLSMEAFLQAPTIERVGCHLRARSTKLNEQPVVPLQPNGSKRPFFFVPSGEGNVFNFHALARRMAPCVTPTGGWEEVSTQPPRVRELPGNHVTLVTEPAVDRLAREFLAAIAEAQP
ncbi:thioesterase domain-containing protein [Corallococcus sp. M7]